MEGVMRSIGKGLAGLLVFSGLVAGGYSERMTPSVDQLAWMAGDWECEIEGGAFQETWLPPAGGTMQGLGRHIKNGKTVFMEFLSIEPDKDGGLTMYIMLGAPSRGDKKPRLFKMTSSSEKSATFEWPENDFPSKIQYSLKAKANLFCRISGKPGGKETFEDYNFKPRK
jgi:hypothetical protein